jgi:hypothetical protein
MKKSYRAAKMTTPKATKYFGSTPLFSELSSFLEDNGLSLRGPGSGGTAWHPGPLLLLVVDCGCCRPDRKGKLLVERIRGEKANDDVERT